MFCTMWWRQYQNWADSLPQYICHRVTITVPALAVVSGNCTWIHISRARSDWVLSVECCCVLLEESCLAWRGSEKTNNTLIFLSPSLMCDSLTVLSKSTEYPLCKKQAIQTEYMLTHCLEGIQGPSCACISSSWSPTLNLANAKSHYKTRLVKPGKEDECSFALLLWTPEKHFQWGWSSTWAVLPRVTEEEGPCCDLWPTVDGVTGKGCNSEALWDPTPQIPTMLSQPQLQVVARATTAVSPLVHKEAK